MKKLVLSKFVKRLIFIPIFCIAAYLIIFNFLFAIGPTPLAYWSLDENTGIYAYDSINNITGTLRNSTWITGIRGSALQFTGAASDVAMVSNSILNLTDGMSFSVWAKTYENNKVAKIIQKGDWDGHGIGQDGTFGWYTHFYVDNKFSKLYWGGGRPQLNKWYFLVGVYDGANVKFYVDGVLKGSQYAGIKLTGTKVRIITLASDQDAKFFNGAIDEPTVYNRALTPEEVTAMYVDYTTERFTIDGLGGSNDVILENNGENIDVKNEAQYGIKKIKVYKDSNEVFNADVNFNQVIDWSDLTTGVDRVSGKSFFHFTQAHPEISSNKTLRIPAVNNTGEVFICPNAQSLNDINKSCSNVYELRGLIAVDGFYEVLVTGTGGSEQNNTSLIISDSGEGSSVQPNVDTHFYADYFDNTTNDPIDDILGLCSISIPDVSLVNDSMTYNSVNVRWEYTLTGGFSTAGLKDWSVDCTSATYEDLSANDDIQVSSPAAAVPEFSPLTLGFTLISAIIMFMIFQKKNLYNVD